VADRDFEIATLLAPLASTIQALALADAIRGWDHKLPTSVSLWWLPTSLVDTVTKMVVPAPKAETPK
jgi:hypothetical protein